MQSHYGFSGIRTAPMAASMAEGFLKNQRGDGGDGADVGRGGGVGGLEHSGGLRGAWVGVGGGSRPRPSRAEPGAPSAGQRFSLVADGGPIVRTLGTHEGLTKVVAPCTKVVTRARWSCW